MKIRLSPLQQASAFVGIVLTLALGLALIIPDSASEGVIIPYMYTPMAAALLMMFVVTREGTRRQTWRDLGLLKRGAEYWPVAVIAPVAVGVAGLLVCYLLPSVSPAAPESVADLIISSVIELLIATVGWTLGEEFGWRGYLLPRLRTLGDRKALVIVGVVWAVWHMPLIFLTSLYHADGNQLIMIPLFVATVVAASFFFGYLRIFSGSVWPASLAHSAHNVAWNFTGTLLVATSPAAEEYVGGDAGIVIVLGTVVATAYLLWRQKQRAHKAIEARTTVTPQATPAGVAR